MPADLQLEKDIFQYVANIPRGDFAFVTGERKYSSGCVFCSYMLYYAAVDFHQIDPYSEFGIVRGTSFFYPINNRGIFDYFMSFCSSVGAPLPFQRLNGLEFLLGSMIKVRYVVYPTSIVGLNVAGGVVDHTLDSSGMMYEQLRNRIESRFSGPSPHKHLLPLIHLP